MPGSSKLFLPFRFPNGNLLACLVYPIRATCHAYHTLLDLILAISDEDRRLWNSLFSFLRRSLYFLFLKPSILLSTKKFNQAGRPSRRDSNPVRPEYGAGFSNTTAREVTSWCGSNIAVLQLCLSAGHDVTPKSCACRLVYWLGYVTAVVVLAAYSATLISFLTIRNQEPHVKTLEALAADGTYKLGVTRQYLRIVRNVSVLHCSLCPSIRSKKFCKEYMKPTFLIQNSELIFFLGPNVFSAFPSSDTCNSRFSLKRIHHISHLRKRTGKIIPILSTLERRHDDKIMLIHTSHVKLGDL
jgi:hypothetical protein